MIPVPLNFLCPSKHLFIQFFYVFQFSVLQPQSYRISILFLFLSFLFLDSKGAVTKYLLLTHGKNPADQASIRTPEVDICQAPKRPQSPSPPPRESRRRRVSPRLDPAPPAAVPRQIPRAPRAWPDARLSSLSPAHLSRHRPIKNITFRATP